MRIRFGCGLDSRIYGILVCIYIYITTFVTDVTVIVIVAMSAMVTIVAWIINVTAELVVIVRPLATKLQVLISCYGCANMPELLLPADPLFLRR